MFCACFLFLQVGACIVNSENNIVGIGYNGMPNGCSDDKLPWNRRADSKLDTKYLYGEKNEEHVMCLYLNELTSVVEHRIQKYYFVKSQKSD